MSEPYSKILLTLVLLLFPCAVLADLDKPPELMEMIKEDSQGYQYPVWTEEAAKDAGEEDFFLRIVEEPIELHPKETSLLVTFESPESCGTGGCSRSLYSTVGGKWTRLLSFFGSNPDVTYNTKGWARFVIHWHISAGTGSFKEYEWDPASNKYIPTSSGKYVGNTTSTDLKRHVKALKKQVSKDPSAPFDPKLLDEVDGAMWSLGWEDKDKKLTTDFLNLLRKKKKTKKEMEIYLSNLERGLEIYPDSVFQVMYAAEGKVENGQFLQSRFILNRFLNNHEVKPDDQKRIKSMLEAIGPNARKEELEILSASATVSLEGKDYKMVLSPRKNKRAFSLFLVSSKGSIKDWIVFTKRQDSFWVERLFKQKGKVLGRILPFIPDHSLAIFKFQTVFDPPSSPSSYNQHELGRFALIDQTAMRIIPLSKDMSQEFSPRNRRKWSKVEFIRDENSEFPLLTVTSCHFHNKVPPKFTGALIIRYVYSDADKTFSTLDTVTGDNLKSCPMGQPPAGPLWELPKRVSEYLNTHPRKSN